MRGRWTLALLVGLVCGLAYAGDDHSDRDGGTAGSSQIGGIDYREAPIDELLRALGADAAPVRRVAATAAGPRAGESDAIVPELIAATGDDDAGVRVAATRALGAAGSHALPAAARLAHLAEHASDDVQRRTAAAALVRIAPNGEPSQALLLDPSGRHLVFAGLAELGADAVATLDELARVPEWRVRAAAAGALAAAGEDDDAALRVVRRLLRDDSPAVRAAALESLPPLGGGGVLTITDVARVFSDGVSTRERLLLVVALMDDGRSAAPTKPHVRDAALAAAAASGTPDEALYAVRMAYAADLHSEPAFLSLARLASSSDSVVGGEAAAALFHATERARLSGEVAIALRAALSNEQAHDVAATAALALWRGGHDGPELAAPATRMLVTYGWPRWSDGPSPSAPVRPRRQGRRNLRAGGGGWGHGVRALPRVPSPGADEVVALLTEHPDAATAPLVTLLAHDAVATRAVAAWTLGRVRDDDAKAAAALRPLLGDRALAVRVVCAIRLARTDEHADAAVTAAVAMLLADAEATYADPVIRDARADGELDDGGSIEWVDALLDTLSRSPRAAIDELVAVRARSTAVLEGTRIDPGTGRPERTQEIGWAGLPGERHVAPMLAVIGEPAAPLLVDRVARGETRSRLAAAWLLAHVAARSAEVNERLGALADDAEIGEEVRRLLGR